MQSDVKCISAVLRYYGIFRGVPSLCVLEEVDVVQKLKWVYEARKVTPKQNLERTKANFAGETPSPSCHQSFTFLQRLSMRYFEIVALNG